MLPKENMKQQIHNKSQNQYGRRKKTIQSVNKRKTQKEKNGQIRQNKHEKLNQIFTQIKHRKLRYLKEKQTTK